MDAAKVCAIRERLRADAIGVGSEVSIDTFFLMVRYTCSDLGVTDAEILDLFEKIDVNGDRTIHGGNQTAWCLQGAFSLCAAAWGGRVPEHAVEVLANSGIFRPSGWLPHRLSITYVFQTFFKYLVTILVLSLWFGLVVMPVACALLAPRARHKPSVVKAPEEPIAAGLKEGEPVSVAGGPVASDASSH